MNDATELFKEQGYLLDDLLATDSWGELYSAIYTAHGRQVLFRRFCPALSDPHAWGLASAEIQAWARIDHPGIIQPLDWGSAPAGSFLATVMPAGMPLASVVSEDSGVELFDPAEVFAGVLEAVEAAARWGVLHLGLGLTNVWVSEGAIGVSEFGLWYVRTEFPTLFTEAGMFAAPEQIEGGRAMAATDVYSLGLLHVALNLGLAAARSAASGGIGDLDLEPVMYRCLAANPVLRPRAGEVAVALGIGADTHDDSMRDCPVCKLKQQIAREMRESPARFGERLRGFMMEEEPYEPARPQKSTPAPSRGHQRSDTLLALFPWIAIGALALATLAVWWLVFR
ncbi:MAG TPA: hypothetical protein VIK15_03615 [Candidatus Anoxymicrobiaceae bacterium]